MENIIIVLLLVIIAELTYLTSLNMNKLKIKKDSNPIFVDTSVLIDGRIVMLAKSGFLLGRICVPRSVLGELQFMADHADNDKRARARYGLDIVKELQEMPGLRIEIFQDSSRAEEGVDDRLINLAKKHNGMISTIDYNLNKVALVEGISVLNINDLAVGLRMSYLPGEKIMLELTQKGQDNHQAIGHLGDGTMVVVEHAKDYIGKSVEIEFVRGLQTAAGKMMFAKLVDKTDKPEKRARRIIGKKPSKKIVESSKKQESASTTRDDNKPVKRKPNNRNKSRRTSRNNEQNVVDLANR